MKTGRFWLMTVAAAVGVAATLALGFWQLGRAREKIALQAEIEQQRRAPVLPHAGFLATQNPAYLLHRPVDLRGTWVPGNTIYLDNRQMKNRQGFYVVTPLRLDGSTAVVLVQRGWVPRNFNDREKLPPVETPPGLVEVRGRMAPPPAKLYDFGGGGTGAIRQNLDLAALRAETGLALIDGSVQQAGPPSQGLLRDWPEPGSGVDKHFGYMFQWWALSGLIALLYAWFQFIAPRRHSQRV